MLDPSEVDRIAQVAELPLMRLVDWKNRVGEPFELRCVPKENGTYALELSTPQPTVVKAAIPVVHGDYESHKGDDGSIVYKGLPGNSMGQAMTPDGRPAFGVGYDLTQLDAEGRPLFKVYFGSATEWFVKNVYHQKWNELREARAELEPDAAPIPSTTTERPSKEAGRNPRDRMRAQQRSGGGAGGGRGGGRGGGGSRSRGGGGDQGGGQGGGGQAGGRRRGRRGGRGRSKGGGGEGGGSSD